jgi:hypothetical protein
MRSIKIYKGLFLFLFVLFNKVNSVAQTDWETIDITSDSKYIGLFLGGFSALSAKGDTLYISIDEGASWTKSWSGGANYENCSRPSHLLFNRPKKSLSEAGPFVVGNDSNLNPKAWRLEGNSLVEINITGTGKLLAAAVLEQTVIFVGEGGTWKSTDGGNTFQQTSLGGADVIYNQIDNKWYLAGFFGIHTSTDGFTWGPSIAPVIANNFAVNSINGDIAIATADINVKILKTNGSVVTLNSGWPFPAFPTSVAYDLEGNLYASYVKYSPATSSSAMKFDNSTQQWNDIGRISGHVINDLEFAVLSGGTTNLLAASTGGLWRMGLGTTDIEDEANSLGSFVLHQNFPNPFNPATTISWELPTNNYVILKVYDVLGNEIAELLNEEQSAGRHQVSFDAIGLSSGTYFYKLTAGNFSKTAKLLLIK